MAVTRVCSVCEKPFEAKRKDAKTCSDRCRQLARRRPDRAAESKQRGVREQVLYDLTIAGRVDTFHGQLALQLADELGQPGVTGVPALSKELRAVMAIALAGVEPKQDGASSPEARKRAEDEVAKARAERDRKRRHAAGRA